MGRIGRRAAVDIYPQIRQVVPSTLAFLFGDGSDGDIVIDTPDTPIDSILNARSITITPTGSIRVQPESHCLLRAQMFIRIDGPINGDAVMSSSLLVDSVAVVQFIGATAEGGSGGGGGGGAGVSGNGLDGMYGQNGNGKISAVGYTHGTGSIGGLPGVGGVGDVGGNGSDATVPVIGVDITGLEDYLTLYPAGPGGYFHGAVPGLGGATGVQGGAGSGGASGGAGGQGGTTEGLGGPNILIVSPNIVANALVSANGGNGVNAPAFGSPGGPIAGDAAMGGSNEGGGGGGSGGGGGGGAAGGLVLLFYNTLTETVPAQANPGVGGIGAAGAPGGAGDGTGFAGGQGGRGIDGATGSDGFVIRQKIA